MSATTVDELLGYEPVADFKRDQWDRPLIVPADGGKAIGYTRCSSAAKTIDDTFNLELWARRNVAYGMAHDRSLVARVLAVGGTPREWDKTGRSAVNKIVEDAQQVAKAHEAADIGTAVHELTHQLDRGLAVIGGPYQADLDAYQAAKTSAGLVVHEPWIECRMVSDDLQMAGTADRIYTVTPDSPLGRFLGLEPGEALIGDLKTGESVDYGGLGWAAQLAAYAHGSLYDVEDDKRLDTPRINRQRGLIVHLPAGQGRCDLYLIDIEAGYEAARLANVIRQTRKEAKRWLEPLSDLTPLPTRDDELVAALEASLIQIAGGPAVPAERIAAASLELRARLNAAVATGARNITWPSGIARFADGGPSTWAEVLSVEAVVLAAEAEAQLPFADKLPDDPTAEPAPRWAEPAEPTPPREPAIDAGVLAELKAAHDALPVDLQHAAKGAVIAAGLPTDRRLWRDRHSESLASILAAAADEHERRKALVASLVQEIEDVVLPALVTACYPPLDDVDEPPRDLAELTADEATRLAAVVAALDEGAIAVTWSAQGEPSLVSDAATEPALLFVYESKAAVLTAAKELATLHGLPKPRSATAAASNPVLAALLLAHHSEGATQP